MTQVFTILLIALILWRMLARELPALLGLIVSTSAVRRSLFMVTIVLLGSVALLAGSALGLSGIAGDYYGGIDLQGVSLVAISAVVTVLLLDYLGMMPSVCVAVLGALEAWRVFTMKLQMDWSLLGSWLLSPLVAAVMAALIYLLCRKTICRPSIHLIKMSGYMRYVVMVGLALLVLAVGINNGSLILLSADLMFDGGVELVVSSVAIFVVGVRLFGRTLSRRMDIAAEGYSDASTQSIASVCYAVIITLLLFSLPLVERVGLRPTPLALGALLVGGFCGVGVIRRSQMPELRPALRTLVGLVLTPIVAHLCYLLLSLLFLGGMGVGEELNLALLVFALMLVMLFFFARYVRKQERLHESSRKLIQNQQQQLYENQKALNVMELNAILAENHSLHGTLELKRKEIINVALGISEQKEFLEMLAEKVHRAAKATAEEKDRIIAEIEKELGQRTSFSG